MFKSIRWRIAIPYILLLLVVMLTLGVILGRFVRQNYLAQIERELTSDAYLLSQALITPLSEQAERASLERLSGEWSDRLGARITIIDPAGNVLADSHAEQVEIENHLDRPEIAAAIRSGMGTSTRFSRTLGYEQMYVASAVQGETGLLGVVRISLPLQEIAQRQNSLVRALTGVTLPATLAALLLAVWIANAVSRPLRQLTRSAEQIAHIAPDSPGLVNRGGEIAQLTQAFHAMSRQVSSQIAALEAERSKLSAVLAEISDGLLILDAAGQVQTINRAAQDLFNVTENEAAGRSLIEVLRLHQVVDLAEAARQSGQTQTTILELPGRQLTLQVIAIPRHLDDSEPVEPGASPGSVPGVLLLFQNLTRLRRLETVRRDFISNISHELRTPLASLKALTETLQEGALEDPPAARRFLSQIETEVDALSQMVTELLELARIESGRVPLQLEPVDPAALLEGTVDRLRLQAERAGLQVSITAGDLPAVLADPVRLEQVLVNLLHNAIKFTPAGGEIRLHAGRFSENPEVFVLFSVQDTGIGISPADLTRIFERFYKADRARSSRGTGLGLAIARHLVEGHGGKLWAESTEGRGSTFYFTVPIAT